MGEGWELRVGEGEGHSPGQGPWGHGWSVVDGWKRVLQEGLLSPCLSTAPHVCCFSGIPCPITIAWALGKLYYENEQ